MQVLKDEIKDSILTSAKKAFIKKGYDKTSMRDIATGANISVGNIYRYFESKETILEMLIEDFEKDIKDYSDYLDDGIFVKKQTNKLNNYIDKLEEVFERNETALLVLSRMNSNDKLAKFEEKIIDNISNRFMKISKLLKTKNMNENVAGALACGIYQGIKSIINKFDKRKDNFKDIKRDLDVYIKISVENLMLRIK